MIPNLETLMRWADWNAALAILGGTGFVMSWFRKGSVEEDAMVIEATNVIFDNLANADQVKQIEVMTGKNLRDQITVEELLDMEKEREMRSFTRRN